MIFSPAAHSDVHDCSCIMSPHWGGKDICRNDTHLSYETNVLVTVGGEKPSYSYSACGGDASGRLDNVVTERLRGRTLRAGIAKSTYPDH